MGNIFRQYLIVQRFNRSQIIEYAIVYTKRKTHIHVNDLATSNKELEKSAYVVSHDLQELLRMVTGFLGQIEKKYSDVIDDRVNNISTLQ